MRNRRVFQRNDCNISVVIHNSGRFLYGEIVDLSLGGVKLSLKGELDAKKVELTPKKSLPQGMAIIPLPYDVRWKVQQEETSAGLQFSGGTDAFFRGWLSDHLRYDPNNFNSLLDSRKLVRLPCQLSATANDDEGQFPCSVLDISLGGLSFVSQQEVWPGMTVEVTLDQHPELGTLELILLRVQALTGHFLCGGKLLEPSSSQLEALETLLEKLAADPKNATLHEDS